jgi:hypothetical protein
MWVFSSDEPFKAESDTRPRTEMRMTVSTSTRSVIHIVVTNFSKITPNS